MDAFNATLGIIGLLVAIVGLIASIIWNSYSAKRDRRKDKSESDAKKADDLVQLEERLQKQIKTSQSGAHARMTSIETNYNSKFREVNNNVNEKHGEQMVVMQQIIGQQQQIIAQQAVAREETQEVRINLKNMMEHNNLKYQE